MATVAGLHDQIDLIARDVRAGVTATVTVRVCLFWVEHQEAVIDVTAYIVGVKIIPSIAWTRIVGGDIDLSTCGITSLNPS